MTHRERVRAVLAGERPDRPVVDLGGRVASVNVAAYGPLKSHLGFGEGLSGETVTFLNTVSGFDERILERFDVPIRRVYLKPAKAFRAAINDDGAFRDEWHVKFVPRGAYNERVDPPLAGATLDGLDRFDWPDPGDPGRTEGLSEEARGLQRKTECSLAAGHISAGVFQDCWNLRGMARFLEDMVVDRDFAEALLDRVTAIHIAMWEQFLDAVGDLVDIVETADDLGGQRGLLISPSLYRELVRPRHAALFAAIRRRARAKILYHSCGAIVELIDDLVEIGVEVLNPIQPLGDLMGPAELRRRFGGRVVFHGGLDVQELLPSARPEQVRAHVRRYFDELGPERYIMAPANTVGPGTPPENLVAAFDEARCYRAAR